MASPAILVVDETFSPPLTTHYLKGDNEIELDAIYHGLHVLLRHPGRGHLTHHPEEQEEAQRKLSSTHHPITLSLYPHFHLTNRSPHLLTISCKKRSVFTLAPQSSSPISGSSPPISSTTSPISCAMTPSKCNAYGLASSTCCNR